MKNHYETLGVQQDAEDVVIRAAYKALAQRYHPDKWTGDTQEAVRKMQEINAAYEVLSNPKKRQDYDASQSIRQKEAKTSDVESKGQPRKSLNLRKMLFIGGVILGGILLMLGGEKKEKISDFQYYVGAIYEKYEGKEIPKLSSTNYVLNNFFDVYDRPWHKYQSPLDSDALALIERDVWWISDNSQKLFVYTKNSTSKNIYGVVFKLTTHCGGKDAKEIFIDVNFDEQLKSKSEGVVEITAPTDLNDEVKKCGEIIYGFTTK